MFGKRIHRDDMPVFCFGVSHHNTPIEVRERLAYTPARLDVALRLARAYHHGGAWSLSEVVLLATCNRTELYGVASAGDPWNEVEAFLAETLRTETATFSSHIVRRNGQAAARHLCRVAAGLESMVLGESEILGQVAEANRSAIDAGASGSILTELFRSATRAGKRARTETAIGRNPASVSSVAVRLAAEAAGSLQGRRAVILGAGRMARKALRALHAQGIGQVTIVNRSPERAAELIREGGRMMAFNQLGQAMARSDIVVCATSAADPLVDTALVRAALARSHSDLILVDIGIPRNVDPAVRPIDGVHLIDMDDINRTLANSVDQRRREVPAVERIVDEETGRFAVWLTGRHVRPVLSAIRRQAEATRKREVAKLAARLPDLDPELLGQIEGLSRSLVNSILEPPSRRLRQEAGNGRSREFTRITRELFGIAGHEASDQDDA